MMLVVIFVGGRQYTLTLPREVMSLIMGESIRTEEATVRLTSGIYSGSYFENILEVKSFQGFEFFVNRDALARAAHGQ